MAHRCHNTYNPCQWFHTTPLVRLKEKMQQCGNKFRDKEECKSVNTDLNNAGFEILRIGCKMFYEEGNAVNTSGIYTMHFGHTECKNKQHREVLAEILCKHYIKCKKN